MDQVELSEALDMVKILIRQGNVRPAAMMGRLVQAVKELQTKAVGKVSYEPGRINETAAKPVAFTEGSEGRG